MLSILITWKRVSESNVEPFCDFPQLILSASYSTRINLDIHSQNENKKNKDSTIDAIDREGKNSVALVEENELVQSYLILATMQLMLQ